MKLGAGVVCLVLVVAIFALRSRSGPPAVGGLQTQVDAARSPSPSSREATQGPRAKPEVDRQRAAELRDKLLTAIRRARQERYEAAKVRPAPGEELPPPDDAIDADYIQERMREIVPMIKECYEVLREKHPDMGGKLITEFVIEGEADTGGIVSEAKILEGSTLVDPALHECVRETVYSLKFDPPKIGGKITVRYPLVFAP